MKSEHIIAGLLSIGIAMMGAMYGELHGMATSLVDFELRVIALETWAHIHGFSQEASWKNP